MFMKRAPGIDVVQVIIAIFHFAQSLEEPGSDSSKFDNIIPTIVRPCTKDTFLPEEDLGEVSTMFSYILFPGGGN